MVVINHKDISVDEEGWGFFEFSPVQAEKLARLIEMKARLARTERG
jgi:hypothetical protein